MTTDNTNNVLSYVGERKISPDSDINYWIALVSHIFAKNSEHGQELTYLIARALKESFLRGVEVGQQTQPPPDRIELLGRTYIVEPK